MTAVADLSVLDSPFDMLDTAKAVGASAVAFFVLQLIFQLTVRPWFAQLLKRNPESTERSRAVTAKQAVPRAVCFVHNAVQIPLALLLLLDPLFQADHLHHTTALSTLVMTVSAGYFLYDTLECLINFEHEGLAFTIHGFVCCVIFTFLRHTGQLHFFGAAFLMWEVSTPFVHVRWFLFKMGRESSTAYLLNAAAMMLVFFACRNVWGVYMSWTFWQDSGRDSALTTPKLAWFVVGFCRLSVGVLNGLNYYWFGKMLQIACGMLLAPKDAKQQALKRE